MFYKVIRAYQYKTGIILFSLITAFAAWMICCSSNTTSGADLDLFGTPTPDKLIERNADIEGQIIEAIETTLFKQALQDPIYQFINTKIDRIQISSRQDWATAWLLPIDLSTGEIIPTEPGLAIIHYQYSQWKVVLPGFTEWMDLLMRLPPDVLSELEKTMWLDQEIRIKAALPSAPLTGYLLPWAGGQTLAMTQSVAHDRYTPSGNAHYAFDFATPGIAQMFNLHAARSGIVKYVKDYCDNGSETCSNWIVLEDTSTTPTTYQLYLHLAQNSIPGDIRSIGTFVRQGQFIGVADDTGISTAHHLHFMVHTNPTSYWGTSVDITFDDVSINGGRPRITADIPYCRNDDTYQDICDQVSSTYISGNYIQPDQEPPYGDILEPLENITHETAVLHLEGWANDDQSGLANAQFLAYFDNTWHNIGGQFTTLLFSYDFDLCAFNVPDGPLSLALRIQDKSGNLNSNLPGLTHITKNYACPSHPVTCNPEADQIALFSEPLYQGDCQVFSTGNYSSQTNFLELNDQVDSVIVGSNVGVTFFINNDYNGRGETIASSDRNLADNQIGANTISSFIVHSKNISASIPTHVYPTDGSTFPTNASMSLVWDNPLGNQLMAARLMRNGETILNTPWIPINYWNVGSLIPGSYTWQLKGKNDTGDTNWSDIRSFNIATNGEVPTSTNVPFSDNMEGDTSKWIRSIYWDRTLEKNHTTGGSISWKYDVNGKLEDGYDTGIPNSGDLTTIPIHIPPDEEYFMRFWYLVETENSGTHWDQRWIQISTDGGAFTNTFQLSQDPTNIWLQSPILPLANYSGHTIQVRFHFETMDQHLNKYAGWFLDDFSITNQPPPTCTDLHEPNNTGDQATQINLNSTYEGNICPNGDMDYYRFNAQVGDHIGIFSLGMATYPSSQLDTFLTLLDKYGKSIIAENDDQVPGERTDSELHITIPEDGEYIVYIRAWDHPSAGGEDYFYALGIYNDTIDPNASFIFPVNQGSIPNEIFNLSVIATDDQSGISHVTFLWHAGDWQTDEWIVIGEDWDGSDGWNMPFDARQLPLHTQLAFYAKVYDRTGNWRGTGVWNIENSTWQYIFPIIEK